MASETNEYRRRRIAHAFTNLCAAVSLRLGLERRYLRALDRRPKHILIVCKGNICRSPYAEYKFRALLAEENITTITVSSRGCKTSAGKPAYPLALKRAKSQGFDLTAHRTQPLAPLDIAAADLILVMEPEHKKMVADVDPRGNEKLLYLGALTLRDGLPLIIEDPYRGAPDEDVSAFQHCFQRIDLALERLLEKLKPS